jgi:hypothetical protein
MRTGPMTATDSRTLREQDQAGVRVAPSETPKARQICADTPDLFFEIVLFILSWEQCGILST